MYNTCYEVFIGIPIFIMYTRKLSYPLNYYFIWLQKFVDGGDTHGIVAAVFLSLISGFGYHVKTRDVSKLALPLLWHQHLCVYLYTESNPLYNKTV